MNKKNNNGKNKNIENKNKSNFNPINNPAFFNNIINQDNNGLDINSVSEDHFYNTDS